MKWITFLTVILLSYPMAVQAQEPDFEGLNDKVRDAYRNDLALLRTVSFHRQVIRQKLKSNGSVKSEEVLDSQITPISGGFDEVLVRIDDRAPSSREVKKHRKSAIFTKHYDELVKGRVNLAFIADITLSLLVDAYNYSYEGEEEIQGQMCYRFAVKPFDPPAKASDTEVIAAASDGHFWIDADSGSIVRMKVSIVRPLKVMGAGLNSLTLSLESVKWGDAWLTKRIEVNSEYELVFTTSRKRNVWIYSDFKKLAE